MKLKVKLYATLGGYLPPGAVRNAVQMEVEDGVTAQQLIDQLRLPPELTHLVLVNGVYIGPDERTDRVLAPDDEFAVFPPIAGG
jgi:sulfur carrier protein ThiS